MSFEPVVTKDGSPTYRFRDGECQEDMHSSRGAFTETLGIYGPVVSLGFLQAEKFDHLRGPKFLSLGLGLGYNEFLIGAHARTHLMEWECDSYELDSDLRQDFLAFILDRDLPASKREIYEQILSLFESASGLRPHQSENPRRTTKQVLKQAFEEGRWRLHGALDLKAANQKADLGAKYDGFLWDAFSRKTSPELWDQNELTEFLNKYRSESSYFSTYACFSALKAALHTAGFKVQVRKAVTGKRESVFAVNSRLELSRDISSHIQ